MAIGKLGFVAALPLLAALANEASACDLAPFVETWTNQGTVTWSPIGNDCRLESRIATTADATASATAHYRRADPQNPFQLTFRIDRPDPSVPLVPVRDIAFARGVARATPAAGPDIVNLFELRMQFQAGGAILSSYAACPSGSGTCGDVRPVAYSSFPLRVTLQLNQGDGPAGNFSLWLGDDTAGTPTVNFPNLDNARWGGMERVAVGLLSASQGFGQALAGSPIVFDRIGVSDPQLFVDGFDSSAADNVVPTVATPISIDGVYPGTTCGGSTKLPNLASGTARPTDKVSIHVLSPSAAERQIAVTTIGSIVSMSLFLCPTNAGPASNCQAARSGDAGPLTSPPSTIASYLIVAPLEGPGGMCSQYSLNVTGSP